jgi:hypothetical protein
VAAAAQQGGFVLLVGGSSVGKSRSAVEALEALVPDWWLVHPAGPAEVADMAAASSSPMVVWLDELQRYLDGERGLTGGVIRAMLDAPRRTVIIGTLWPDWYTFYTARPTGGNADLHAREREVLDLADVIRLGPEFSLAEQDRARSAATRDRRVAIALNTAGYGLTQTLAAAPQLVARWEDAQTTNPYAWALLTAALDAARLGARAPLTAGLLRAATPGYCTSQQQAEAPENWFEQALAYATGKLHGAAAPLSPVGRGMGTVVGYVAADYLIQHATLERCSARVPADTWDALSSHVTDPADAGRLARSAEDRLLYCYAIPLYQRAVGNVEDKYAVQQLARLLVKRGDLDGAERILRSSADAGHDSAREQLADLLLERSDLDGADQILRSSGDMGSWYVSRRLTDLLVEGGELDGLRARADADDEYAASRLAALLSDRGDLDGLRARADADDEYAASRLAALLSDRGDLDGLRARADAGDGHAARRVGLLLAQRGDRRGAEQILRSRADAADAYSAGFLAVLLALWGDQDGAEQILRALTGDGAMYVEGLADSLREGGNLDVAAQLLQQRAPALRHRDAHSRVRPRRTWTQVQSRRAATLRAAYAAHPERFRGRCPQPKTLPAKVWINEPPATIETSPPPQTPQSA